VRASKLAAKIYAPLGTFMALGDYVRVVRAFLEAFKEADLGVPEELSLSEDENDGRSWTDLSAVSRLCKDLQVRDFHIYAALIMLSIAS
jgi:glycerol-3-phosphate O-acyltransferase / dihydroxyacetone phosphate acyltransferase